MSPPTSTRQDPNAIIASCSAAADDLWHFTPTADARWHLTAETDRIGRAAKATATANSPPLPATGLGSPRPKANSLSPTMEQGGATGLTHQRTHGGKPAQGTPDKPTMVGA
jgi:hypothetical protein